MILIVNDGYLVLLAKRVSLKDGLLVVEVETKARTLAFSHFGSNNLCTT